MALSFIWVFNCTRGAMACNWAGVASLDSAFSLASAAMSFFSFSRAAMVSLSFLMSGWSSIMVYPGFQVGQRHARVFQIFVDGARNARRIAHGVILVLQRIQICLLLQGAFASSRRRLHLRLNPLQDLDVAL